MQSAAQDTTPMWSMTFTLKGHILFQSIKSSFVISQIQPINMVQWERVLQVYATIEGIQ